MISPSDQPADTASSARPAGGGRRGGGAAEPVPPSAFIPRLAALAGYLYLNLAGFTTSLRFHAASVHPLRADTASAADLPAGRAGVPPGVAPQVIYVLWHCQQAFLIYAHRGRGIAVLTSKSRDGEYVAGILKRFGYLPVRGSTSSGGLRSLIQLIRCAREGRTLAITPDGPRGPGRKVQQGAVYLARKTGLPVIAVAVSLSNKVSARSWDRFQIPLPFGRAAVAYSAPFYVAETDRLEDKAAELEKILNETGLKAGEMLKNRS